MFARLERAAIPSERAFYLMEDWVVRSIDGVPPVDVATDGVAIASVCPKDVDLVCGRVSAKDCVLVEVVGVRFATPRMVAREAQ